MHRKQIVHEYVRSAAVEPHVAHPLASGLLSVYFGADILEVVEWQTAGSDDQRALLIVHRNEWFLVTVNSGSALDADPLDYQAEVATVRLGELQDVLVTQVERWAEVNSHPSSQLETIFLEHNRFPGTLELSLPRAQRHRMSYVLGAILEAASPRPMPAYL